MGVADHPLSDEGMKAFVADSKVMEIRDEGNLPTLLNEKGGY